jgi:hypothetical protein
LLLGLVALLTYAPLALWLTVQFGSPLPTTLQTKSAQAVSGLTGFYPFTSFPAGMLLLLRALLEQSSGLVLFFSAALLGLIVMWRLGSRATGMLMPVMWAATNLLGYTVLGVAPYVWYYAPAVPGLVCLAALAAYTSGAFKTPEVFRTLLRWALPILIIVSLGWADLGIVNVLRGATPPAPDDLRAKLLPETKVDVYERVGRWVQSNTPADATLGVTELGVMSYYAQRHTIDFLGLTQPAHLSAIRHGDYMQALLREQPDYLALSSVNALYDADPQKEVWFTAIYTPVARFDDTRFWGSPMVVWQRRQTPVLFPVTLDTQPHDLGAGWKVTAVMANTREVTDGKPLFLRLRMQAGAPVGNRTLRVQPVLIQGGDGLPVSSRLVHTNQWRVGESDWLDVVVMPQPNPPRGGYAVEISWLEGDQSARVRAGTLKVALNEPRPANTVFAPLSRGVGIAMIVSPIRACIGATTPITLVWQGGTMDDIDYTAFVQVRRDAHVLAGADAPPRAGTYPTSVWSADEIIPDPHQLEVSASVPPGDYDLVVGLYHPPDNTRWPVDDSLYRTSDGGVRIGQITLKTCDARP